MKKHFLKYSLIISIVLLFSLLFVTETYLREMYGIPPAESDPPQFQHQYVNIYKRFFKKVHNGNKTFYETVPSKALYQYSKFPAVKKPDTLRFFILGGSVAASFPLQDFTGSLFPNKNIEVVNCGMGSYDSYRNYLVAKEIVSYAPDLVIVLAGNNESYKRYKINLTAYYINRFLRKFWIYRKPQNYISHWIKNQESNPMEKRLKIYEKNIRRIVHLMHSRNTAIILCTLPCNFKDCPPNGHFPVDKQFLLSSFLLENKDYYNAVKGFQEFLKKIPDNSFGLYFLGRAYEGIKDYNKAKECYLKAWDLGFIDGGAGETSNKIIRQICKEEKVIVADFEKLFIQISPFGLCGRNLFYDYCHLHQGAYPRQSGAYSLFAECIAQAIFDNKGLYVSLFGKTGKIQQYLSSSDKQYDFLQDGNIKWTMLTGVWEVFNGVIDEMRDNRICPLYDERAISYLETLYLMNTDMFWELQFMKEDIVNEFPQYVWIKELFVQYRPYSQRLWANLLCYVGETYRRLEEYDKALSLFDSSISMNGSDYRPHLGKALTYYALGKQQQIVQENFAQAEKVSENDEQKLVIQYYKEFLGL